MALTLFQQIAKKEVSLLDKISETDKSELESRFSIIREADAEYKAYKTFIQALPPAPKAKHLKINEYLEGCVKSAASNLAELKRKELSRIVGYFNKRYNLSVSFDKEIEPKAIKSEKAFLKAYFQAGGITDLKKGGAEKLIKDLYKKVDSNWSIRATLQSKSVRLKDFFWIDEHYLQWDKEQWHIKYTCRDDMRLLGAALLFFETNQLGCNSAKMNECVPYNYIRETIKDFLIFEKLDKIQYYKNGSIKITFTSKQYAEEFFKLFRFDQLRTRNNY